MPTFKTNLDLQKNQLLNAALENLSVRPISPVEGQVYYDSGKKTAYLWNGSNWAVWGETSSMGTDIKQYMLNIPNPSFKTDFLFIRLFQNQVVLRIDSYISDVGSVLFDIESRVSVNVKGISITEDPIEATNEGIETIGFLHPGLAADNWLYLNVMGVEGTIGVLTITITCAIDDRIIKRDEML